MFNGRPLLPRARIVLGAAALLAACCAARADFTVSYNAQDRRISIIDNATGAVVISPDPDLHQTVFDPSTGPGDPRLDPIVSWAPHGTPDHADGLDLTFTFDNSAGSSPALPGAICVPGIVFGLPSDQLGVIHTRDFDRDGKAYSMSPDRPTTGLEMHQENKYPGDLFSPLAFLNAGRYAVGVSVLYPLIDPSWTSLQPCPNDYAHRVGIGIHLLGATSDARAWRVRAALAAADFWGGAEPNSSEGLVPAHQVRQYTLCVRVTDGLRPTVPEQLAVPFPENEPDAALESQAWLKLFAPYKEYFGSRYFGVRYTADPRPVLGCTTSQVALVSPESPFGFGSLPGGGGRPYPDGWGRWHTYLQSQRARGWSRYMIWTPTGVFAAEAGDYNFPFQFTSQWRHQVVPGGEPSMLSDLTDTQPDGSRLGLWWGNSAHVMRTWPPKPDTGVAMLDPASPQHQTLARTELDGAVNTANAEMIGLDAFVLPPWKSYRWVRQLQAWYPGRRFIQEPQPCDIMSTLSPGFTTGTRPAADAGYAVETPWYLAELLLPGHELWASIDQNFLEQTLGHHPSEEEVIAKARDFAVRGYVPVIYGDPDLAGQDVGAVRPPVVPCELLYPSVVTQPPAEVRAVSGATVIISAAFSNEADDDFHWHRSIAPYAWVEIGDVGDVSGTITQNLVIAPVRQSDAGLLRLRARDRLGCVDVLTTTVNLVVCGAPDFNHDGDSATDADIEAFFACLGGNCCATCDTADFNGDGETATDADIEAFFRALAGAGC
jgi:hypothetical protein